MPIALRTVGAVSFAAAALSVTTLAQANNSLLFPFVTTAASAYTFVTVVENPFAENGLSPNPAERNIGYSVTYGIKPITALPSAQCSHRGFGVTMRQGGLLQWEVGNRFNLPSDFGDLYHSDMGASQNRVPVNYQGFMVVEYDQPASNASSLHGEAVIIDSATGMAVSYVATNEASAQADFSRRAGSEFLSSWFPRSLAGATWYVLPLGSRQAMTPTTGGGISSKVVVRTNLKNMGAYERNGSYFPGVKVQEMNCFGVFSLDALLHDEYEMGGWFSLKTLKTYAADTSTLTGDFQPAQVWKLQQSGELGMPVTTMHAVEALR